MMCFFLLMNSKCPLPLAIWFFFLHTYSRWAWRWCQFERVKLLFRIKNQGLTNGWNDTKITKSLMRFSERYYVWLVFIMCFEEGLVSHKQEEKLEKRVSSRRDGQPSSDIIGGLLKCASIARKWAMKKYFVIWIQSDSIDHSSAGMSLSLP
jgi:hypothetical protein